ncbi:MAG: hypothetical protein AAF492_12605 [Verrucomicrobiota bacterium]
MNTPTHIVFGACLAYGIASRFIPDDATRTRKVGLGALIVGAGVLSHLGLDLMPHYAWVVYLNGLENLPYDWLVREALFGLALAVPAFRLAREQWPYVALGMAGGMYPDIEKVAALDFHVPDAYILFDWHSTKLSNRTGGLPLSVLIVIEVILIALALGAMGFIRRNTLSYSPEAPEPDSEQRGVQQRP